ncbi:phenylacetate--CoA ligase [Candidatus Dependentiae bacterium]|nr:phenylacetate--CoA ligase [Candidatus Dependentiae bacterium]
MTNHIFNPKFESMNKKELQILQFERLQSTLNRVYNNVEFYKKKFNEINFMPEDLKSLNDLRKLPFTSKNDLKDSYPYQMFAVPLRDIIQIHSSTGTTGKPIIVGYTKNDIKHWAELNARTLASAGVTNDDLVQISFHYGLTTGGFGLHLGAEKIGASIVPASTGQTKKQIDIMLDYKTTILLCTPSYGLYIAENLEKMKIKKEDLYLRVGIFGSEPWSERMRESIETGLNIQAFDNYGLTEIMGPGVSYECPFKNGLHINEDHFIAELINPNTLEPVSKGQAGELVFTTIAKEGFPLIRYRTGDIAFLIEDKCECGRTFTKMSRVFGRSDDMFIVKGVKIFPSQIEKILSQENELLPHYQILIKREHRSLDEIEVRVEVNEEIFNDDITALNILKENIEHKIHSEIGVVCKVTLVEEKSLRRTGGKTKRVIDTREY